jgi:radical SAM superfamily enzyme YgiQ (UPF0313 family)
MSRVLLVGPSKPTSGKSNWAAPPLGLHRLAAWLRQECNAQVVVHDPCLLGVPIDEELHGYDIIGFSPLCETLPNDLPLMTRAAVVNPNAVLVAGGVEATLNYQTILERTTIEWIVLGEGEEAIASIVRGDRDVPGTIHRAFAKPTTDEALWDYYRSLDFSRMGYEEYWRQTSELRQSANDPDVHTVRLVTSTHCNRGCTFCSVTQWHKAAVGHIARPARLSAEHLLALVEKVKRQIPQTQTVYFCEDDFCLERQRVVDFCQHSAELGVSYLIQTHSSRVDPELIDVMANGGIRHITLGIENVSDSVLKSFHKPQRLEKIPAFIEQCAARSITPYLLIILFAPCSTIADLKLNLTTLRQWIDMGAIVSIEPFTMVYRGAPFYDSGHEFEYTVETPEGCAPFRLAQHILPDDPTAREAMLVFRERWPDYRDTHTPAHAYKGVTGRLALDLLEEVLRERQYV